MDTVAARRAGWPAHTYQRITPLGSASLGLDYRE
jgi:hypothetical protein